MSIHELIRGQKWFQKDEIKPVKKVFQYAIGDKKLERLRCTSLVNTLLPMDLNQSNTESRITALSSQITTTQTSQAGNRNQNNRIQQRNIPMHIPLQTNHQTIESGNVHHLSISANNNTKQPTANFYNRSVWPYPTFNTTMHSQTATNQEGFYNVPSLQTNAQDYSSYELLTFPDTPMTDYFNIDTSEIKR